MARERDRLERLGTFIFLIIVKLSVSIMEACKQGTLVNSEDPDEMWQIAALHQGLHCLLFRDKNIYMERKAKFFEFLSLPHCPTECKIIFNKKSCKYLKKMSL